QRKVLVAYVVPRKQPGPNAEDLRAHLRARLPDYMVPASFVILEKFPVNANGKVDRQALPLPGEQVSTGQKFEEPMGEVERLLAQIWKDVLHVPSVGRHDNFFSLGGHSLLMVEMLERIRVLGFSAPIREMYASATLMDMALVLRLEAEAEKTP